MLQVLFHVDVVIIKVTILLLTAGDGVGNVDWVFIGGGAGCGMGYGKGVVMWLVRGEGASCGAGRWGRVGRGGE